MATDLAEFVGAAVGLNLLFGVPLFVGLIAAIVLVARAGAARSPPLRAGHGRLLGIVLLVCTTSRWSARSPRASRSASPPAGADSILLAAGIDGATVMPHVVYLHSALSQAASQLSAVAALPALGRRRRTPWPARSTWR